MSLVKKSIVLALILILYIFLFICALSSSYENNGDADPVGTAFLALLFEAFILAYPYMYYKRWVKDDDHSDINSEADCQRWLEK